MLPNSDGMLEPAVEHIANTILDKFSIADAQTHSKRIYLVIKLFLEIRMIHKFDSSFAERIYGMLYIVRVYIFIEY